MRLRELDDQALHLQMVRCLAAAQIQPHFPFKPLASLQHWIDTGDQRGAALLKSFNRCLRAALPMFESETIEVFYFESDSRYTRVVHDGGEALVRTPLKELLASLDPEMFWQVHRSLLVNSRRIASAIRIDDHAMVITLNGCDARLPVSRQFQGLFRAH